MKFRMATLDDAADLVRLVALFREFYAVQQEQTLDKLQDFVRSRILSKDSFFFVGEYDHTIVAFAHLISSFSTINLSPIWILNDLYVD